MPLVVYLGQLAFVNFLKFQDCSQFAVLPELSHYINFLFP